MRVKCLDIAQSEEILINSLDDSSVQIQDFSLAHDKIGYEL